MQEWVLLYRQHVLTLRLGGYLLEVFWLAVIYWH